LDEKGHDGKKWDKGISVTILGLLCKFSTVLLSLNKFTAWNSY